MGVPYKTWGTEIDDNSHIQMREACDLPIAVKGALMPDAHLGYGLPIGGVLATDNVVIPYAVGVDIACRMKLTVYDLGMTDIRTNAAYYREILCRNTQFGIGSEWSNPLEHPVLEHEYWDDIPILKENKDKGRKQLGTSGSGNHFAEFGFYVDRNRISRLALLTHSGSRGTGAAVCATYSKLAAEQHPEGGQLAWLDLDSQAGQEYWAAMNIMGEYAAANHKCIHDMVSRSLGSPRIHLEIENHHNFAWKEVHDGRELIVHRKGATPAGAGVMGVIPGSMGSHTYVVKGLGNPDSLNSASHGAGRVMSRKQANKTFDFAAEKARLAAMGIDIISAGADEVPGVYKDIEHVMAAQWDLVEPVGTFSPKIVRMAGSGRAED